MSFELTQSLNERNREDSQDYIKLLLEDARFYKQGHGNLDGWKPKDVYQRTTVFGASQSPRNDVRGNLGTIVSQIADAEIVSKINEYLGRKEEIQKTVQSQTQEVKKESPQKSDIQETITPNEELPEIAPKDDIKYELLPDFVPADLGYTDENSSHNKTDPKPNVSKEKKGEGGKKQPPALKNNNTSQHGNVPKEQNNTSNVPVAMVMTDGRYYMIGADGKKKKIEYSQYSQGKELSSELTEAQKARLPLVMDISLFLEAFSAENPNEAQKVETAWKSAIAFLKNGAQDPQKITNQIVVDTIGPGWGASKWYEIFAIKDNAKRRLEIYKGMKSMGQYALVANHIANEYMRKWSISDIDNAIAKVSQGATLKGFSQEQSKKIAEEMEDAKKAYQDEWTKNKQQYIDAYKKQMHLGAKSTLTPAELKNAENVFIANGVRQEFRISVLKTRLRSQVNWKGDHNNPMLDIASSILGTGTMNMSSRMARETTQMLAIEALAIAAGTMTAGLGTLTINALSASRVARFATLGTEAGSLARFGVSTVANGAAFELGHGGVKSLIEGENMYSLRGFGDSILFTGVLGGVNRVLSGSNKLAAWSRTEAGGIHFGKGVLIDGVALNIAGVTSKIVFQDDIVWSPEEVAQAFIMAGAFRGVTKFTASKNPKGDITVTETKLEEPKAPTSNVQIFTTKTGKYDYQIIKNGDETLYFKGVKGSGNFSKPMTYEELPPSIKNKISGNNSVKNTYEQTLKANQEVKTSSQPPETTVKSTEQTQEKHQQQPKKDTNNNTQSQTIDKSKTTETVSQNTETVIRQAASPIDAQKAIKSVENSTRKMGESFSPEWLAKMSHRIGKPISWLAEQTVGPVFKMVTGNNPGALLGLVNPMGGWTGKASTYGKNFFEHWKHPVKNVVGLTMTGVRNEGQGALSAIAKNVVLAGGLTAIDYFAVPNEAAINSENMAQNYYEVLLLGWLGIVIMEFDPIQEGAKDIGNLLWDRMGAKPF